MKKILLLLLLATFGMQAQEYKEKIKGEIEINGHIIKKDVWFKASLDGIEIYDKDKNQYKKRSCNEKDCKIIHLESKHSLLTSGSMHYYPNIKITN